MMPAIQLCSAALSLRLLDASPAGNEWPSYGGREYPNGSDRLREKAVTDLIYLLTGVGVLALFAGYAVLLRRA
jgi:hypothetical protein